MRSIVVLVLVLLASSVAVAQPDKIKAEAAARDGQQRYSAGEYLLAAERFELAYKLDPDPAYLFNLAQSYRLGNACAKAAAAYRQMLAVVKTGPNVAKVQGYIEQTDACAKTQAAPVEPPRPPPPTVVEVPVQPPPVQPQPVVRSSEGGSSVLRYAGIGVGVVGLVGVAIGVHAAKQVRDFSDKREALCADGCVWTDVMDTAASYDRDGKKYQRRMLIGLIGGGAALAAGVAMVVLGGDSGTESPVAIVPTEGGAMAFGTLQF